MADLTVLPLDRGFPPSSPRVRRCGAFSLSPFFFSEDYFFSESEFSAFVLSTPSVFCWSVFKTEMRSPPDGRLSSLCNWKDMPFLFGGTTGVCVITSVSYYFIADFPDGTPDSGSVSLFSFHRETGSFFFQRRLVLGVPRSLRRSFFRSMKSGIRFIIL